MANYKLKAAIKKKIKTFTFFFLIILNKKVLYFNSYKCKLKA